MQQFITLKPVLIFDCNTDQIWIKIVKAFTVYCRIIYFIFKHDLWFKFTFFSVFLDIIFDHPICPIFSEELIKAVSSPFIAKLNSHNLQFWSLTLVQLHIGYHLLYWFFKNSYIRCLYSNVRHKMSNVVYKFYARFLLIFFKYYLFRHSVGIKWIKIQNIQIK